MMQKVGVFGIDTPEEFFASIQRVFDRFKFSTARDAEDLFYVLMGLNHLREWIAPEYHWKSPHSNSAELFHNQIYDDEPSFKTVQALCNRTKHMKSIPQKIVPPHLLNIDDWEDVDSVKDFDTEAVLDYYVDNENLIEICENVIRFYREKWFEKGKKASGT